MVRDRELPPIRGAEEKVSSFLGVEIGELSYLFILLALQTRYLTEVREQLLRHVDAFGDYEPCSRFEEHERGLASMFTKALELGRPVEVEYRDSVFFGPHRVPASVRLA